MKTTPARGLVLCMLVFALALVSGCTSRAADATSEGALFYLRSSGALLEDIIRAAGDANFQNAYERQQALAPISGDRKLARFQDEMLKCYAAAQGLDDEQRAIDAYTRALERVCLLLEAETEDGRQTIARFAMEFSAIAPPAALLLPHNRMLRHVSQAVTALEDLDYADLMEDPLMRNAGFADLAVSTKLISQDIDALTEAIKARVEELDAAIADMSGLWRAQSGRVSGMMSEYRSLEGE